MDLKEIMRGMDPAALRRRLAGGSSGEEKAEGTSSPVSTPTDGAAEELPADHASGQGDNDQPDTQPASPVSVLPTHRENEIPDLRAIMRGMDPQALRARLAGTGAEMKAREAPKPEEKKRSRVTREAKPPESPSDHSVWQFFVEPVAKTIEDRTLANPLLPVFLVENPYPDYTDQFKEALEQACRGYKVIQVDGKDSERLANLVVHFATNQAKGVILFCTSRGQIPKDFRSLIRSDGYLSIPSLNTVRLQQYASRSRPDVTLDAKDIDWIKWIGPQELLVADGLGDGHWLEGLRQLASQHSAAQVPGHTRKLDEMYGVESARNWAKQLFNDMTLAREGKIDWAEVDRGALLAGPPGTGKTTLARAIATESGANFIAVSAVKDWMTGNGLDESIKLMATTFSTARQQAPSIIFIDEIDSIGNRDEFTGQNASWNTAFLNALLTEMDGFDDQRQVIVIGATNHPENIDAALKRAGRLDRLIRLARPSVNALADMYRGMLKQYPHDLDDQAICECAANSLGLTGADIEVLVRGARRRARLDGHRSIHKDDVLEEIYRIPPDAERRPLSPVELENTAYHEAGHALVGLLLESTSDHVRMASIIADSDGALGFVAVTQSEQNETRASLRDRICMTLAGRATEEIVFGKDRVSTGAGGASSDNDLATSRRLAEAYVGIYGFSEKRPNWYAKEGVEEEAAAIVGEQFKRASEILLANREKLDGIANALLKDHAISRNELVVLAGVSHG